jgi:hypothetical protein
MIDFASLGIVADPHGPAEQRTSCPYCQGSQTDTLGCNINTGQWHCFRCDSRGNASRPEAEGDQRAQRVTRIDDPGVAARKRERLRRTWRETVALSHVKARAVCQYLEARALGQVLQHPPRVLRAHPALAYWDGTREVGKFPALIALFHGVSGDPVTLHVTYVRSDGCVKAPVPNPKKILGVPVKKMTRGGAIHLYEPHSGVLGVAEGIENALSLHVMRTIPVWASYCADNLGRVYLPKGLRELHIGIDVDESGKGERVARSLAGRVKQWSPKTKIVLWRPEGAAADLNDELLRHRRVG